MKRQMPFGHQPQSDMIRCQVLVCHRHKVGSVWCHKHGTLITRFRPRSRTLHRTWPKDDPFGQWMREFVGKILWPRRNCPSRDD